MGNRNETVDAWRAVAALAVCAYHFTEGHFRDVSVIVPLTKYGHLGVQIFFVISGFIVPYAMTRQEYSLRHWPQFMLKRLVRLEPPYLAAVLGAVLFCAVLGYPTENWSVAQVAFHAGYLAPAFGFSWLNVVFWTLAVELQFYLIISLLLPALVAGSSWSRIALLAGLCAVPTAVPALPREFIFMHLPVFSAGLLTFCAHRRLISERVYWPCLLSIAVLLWAISNLGYAVATFVTAAVIAKVQLPRIGVLAWFGAISYSLYLWHRPVGGLIVYQWFGSYTPDPLVEILALCIAFPAAVMVAWVSYVLIERPVVRAAGAVRYREVRSSARASGLPRQSAT